MLVDARGLNCPMPVVNAKAAIDQMEEPGEVKVLVDNEIAVQNLVKFAASENLEAKSNKLSDNEFEVIINAIAGDGASDNDAVNCVPDARDGDMVVVLSSKCMGTGDETLGGNLMKAFIFALTKQDKLPQSILLYNSGAFLSCEDSESLEDLKLLEAEGANILTCGTCLDFYGVKEKLAVGTVTNMFEIVEKQEKAGIVIRP